MQIKNGEKEWDGKHKKAVEYGEQGFTVYDFMSTHLNLKAPTLYVYALIYSFSIVGNYEFYAQRSYIAKRCGISLSSVTRSLKELVDKKLIIRLGVSSKLPKATVYRADTYLVGLVLAEMDKEGREREKREREEFKQKLIEEHRETDKIDIKEYIKTL